MVAIQCDNCERTFEADPADGDAPDKVPCPFCGDVNRVPAGPRTGDRSEQQLRIVRPAMFRAHPFRFLSIAALFVTGVALSIWVSGLDQGRWLIWPCLLLSAAAVVWWLWWLVSAYLWINLRITDKRTIRREGIIRRHTSEVLHDHVRNVEIKQSFIQRLFGVGYLGISSAGQDDIEIEIRDVPKPYEIKALIDRHRSM